MLLAKSGSRNLVTEDYSSNIKVEQNNGRCYSISITRNEVIEMSKTLIFILVSVLVLIVRNEKTQKSNEFKYPEDEPFKADSVKKWIRKNSGIYLPLPGCLQDFDFLADKFMETLRLELRSFFFQNSIS